MLAVVDFLSQLAIVALGFWLVLSPEVLLDNLAFFGEAPTLSEFLLAIPIGTVAYTGIETISNMAGEARDHETTIPAAIKRVMIAVFAIYFTLPLVALSALPVECVGGECRDAARRRPARTAATRTTRSSASSRAWTSARMQGFAEATSACSP